MSGRRIAAGDRSPEQVSTDGSTYDLRCTTKQSFGLVGHSRQAIIIVITKQCIGHYFAIYLD